MGVGEGVSAHPTPACYALVPLLRLDVGTWNPTVIKSPVSELPAFECYSSVANCNTSFFPNAFLFPFFYSLFFSLCSFLRNQAIGWLAVLSAEPGFLSEAVAAVGAHDHPLLPWFYRLVS